LPQVEPLFIPLARLPQDRLVAEGAHWGRCCGCGRSGRPGPRSTATCWRTSLAISNRSLPKSGAAAASCFRTWMPWCIINGSHANTPPPFRS
jgi:hypothetical protein